MPEFDLWILIIVVPVIAIAGWIHGALGLGFPLVATPIIAVFVDVKAAIFITLLPTAAVNVASAMTAENVSATVIKYQVLILASLFGAVSGSILLTATSPDPYRLLLAFLIVTFLLTDHFNLRLKINASVSMMLLFGCIAGFAGGTTNVMVAVLIIYFMSVNTERRETVPAMNLCFLVGKSSQIVVFLLIGVVSLKWLICTTPLAVLSFLTLKAGQRAGERIAAERYKRILKMILLVLAAVLIGQFIVKQ